MLEIIIAHPKTHTRMRSRGAHNHDRQAAHRRHIVGPSHAARLRRGSLSGSHFTHGTQPQTVGASGRLEVLGRRRTMGSAAVPLPGGVPADFGAAASYLVRRRVLAGREISRAAARGAWGAGEWFSGRTGRRRQTVRNCAHGATRHRAAALPLSIIRPS